MDKKIRRVKSNKVVNDVVVRKDGNQRGKEEKVDFKNRNEWLLYVPS